MNVNTSTYVQPPAASSKFLSIYKNIVVSTDVLKLYEIFPNLALIKTYL